MAAQHIVVAEWMMGGNPGVGKVPFHIQTGLNGRPYLTTDSAAPQLIQALNLQIECGQAGLRAELGHQRCQNSGDLHAHGARRRETVVSSILYIIQVCGRGWRPTPCPPAPKAWPPAPVPRPAILPANPGCDVASQQTRYVKPMPI